MQRSGTSRRARSHQVSWSHLVSGLLRRLGLRHKRVRLTFGVALLLLLVPACETRPSPDPRKPLEHEGTAGTVVSVDLETDELFLRVTPNHPGGKLDRTMVFKVEPETETFIDDALRGLSEVKIGDTANVISHPDPLREGGNIAVAIVIDRQTPPLPDPDWMNPNTRAAASASEDDAAATENTQQE